VLKLLDFGIAHAERHAPADAAARETTSRGVLGTPAYMSPEQARGRWDLVDARSDLWSVAAMLFMLLAGEPVHAAQTENERLGLAMSTPARSLRAARPEIPAAVARVIDRALAYDPADRWANAPDFRRALVEAMRVSDQVDGWSTHTTLQDGASLTGFRRKMRKGLVAGLSLALASALTFGVRLHVRATSTATLERPTMPATASSELRLAAAPARDERLAVPRLELSARERSVVPSRSSSRKTAAAPRPAALAASRSTPARAGGSLERLLDVRMIATHARGEGALLDRRE
jgi:serine/threonine protein kinase